MKRNSRPWLRRIGEGGGIFDGLELLATEFTHKDLRPDTVAFDTEKNSFVIIEYKNIRNKQVLDQGATYYRLLQENQDAFVLLYNNTKNKHHNIDDFNWDETYVIFLSREYTKYQIGASGLDGLPIKLYKILQYEDGIITLNRINDRSIKDNKKSEKELPPTVSIKLSEYTEEGYLNGEYRGIFSEKTRDLYHKFKNKILDRFPDVGVRQTSAYVGFYIKDNDEYICTFAGTKEKINLAYSIKASANILVPSDFIRDMEKTGQYGIGDYQSKIADDPDIEKALPHLQAVYDYKAKL